MPRDPLKVNVETGDLSKTKLYNYEDPKVKCEKCGRQNLKRSFGLPYCPTCKSYANKDSEKKATWMVHMLSDIYERYGHVP